MFLKSFRVRDFQSIFDSNLIDVGDVTCLVGKNEAGKTALLRALYRLNPISAGENQFDATDDYPRSKVTKYEQEVKAGKRHPSIVTTATFALTTEEIRPIEEHFGAGVLPDATVTFTRGYENKTCYDLNVSERVAGETLLARANLAEAFRQEDLTWNTLKELSSRVEQRAQAHQSEAAERLRSELATILETDLRQHIYGKYLQGHLPRFLYFDDYYQMRGCENIQGLQSRIANGQLLPSDHPIIGLIDLAALELDDLLSPSRTQQLKNKLQGAGNHLTDEMLNYWSQNKHLRLAFDVRPALAGDPEDMRTGTNIWAEVVDQKHYVNTALGTRSRGFVWFFSFLAWYSRLKTTESQIILLLDEPGLSLHAKAQEDLLRYFEEELKGVHQLIYTTHSPFMIDPRHFERVRIVQDRSIDSDVQLPPEEEGTKVLVDVLDAGPDSLFPLQGALGYEIYQGLFIGPNSLVVEGPSDLLYVQTLSSILTGSGREGLSPAWTITPVGGADKVPTFVALIGAQKALRVATLIDFQKSNAQMIENLYKRRLLSKNHVMTFADFTSTAEADIEDMFERDFYLRLVNEEYQKQLSAPITLADLNPHHPRILFSIEAHLKQHPLTSGTFNHYRPARYFTENAGSLAQALSPATLDRFEAAFKALNSLLPA